MRKMSPDVATLEANKILQGTMWPPKRWKVWLRNLEVDKFRNECGKLQEVNPRVALGGLVRIRSSLLSSFLRSRCLIVWHE